MARQNASDRGAGCRKRVIDLAPRGGAEPLARALACLPDAEDLEAARRQIHPIATLFNYFSYRESVSPTRAQIRGQFRALEKQAEDLAATIADLHEAAEDELRDRAGPSSDLDLDALRDGLDALRRHAAEAAGELEGDARGELNHWRQRYKPAKWRLAAQCGGLLADSGPLPTGYADPDPQNPGSGLFARLVAAVYEYATGHESTAKGAGLERYVKKVAPLFRKRFELVEKAFEASGGKPIGFASRGSEYFGPIADIDRELHDLVGPPFPFEWILQDQDDDGLEQEGKEDD
jgi:hypothetical protein